MARSIGAIVHRAVNQVLIDALPENAGRTLDQGLDENFAIKLVDVISVNDGIIKTIQIGRDPLGKLRIAIVKRPCQSETEQCRCNRDSSKNEFRRVAGLRLSTLGLLFRRLGLARSIMLRIQRWRGRAKHRVEKS